MGFRRKVTTIEENTDLDKGKIEELMKSLQNYEHTQPYSKKNKSIALNTFKEEICDKNDDETLEN